MPDFEKDAKEAMLAALKKEETPAAEAAASEKEETAEEVVEPVSEDDTLTDDEKAAKEKPGDVPYDRFKEKIDEVNTLKAENAKLLSSLTDTLKAVRAGETITKTEKAETKEDIETLVKNGVVTREDADNFIRFLTAAGVNRGPSKAEEKLSAVEKELETMKALVYGDKDQQNLKAAVAEYDGIVTEAQVKAKLKEMIDSKDPDRVYAANNFSYGKIIAMEFGKEIYAAEEKKVAEAKKPAAPKVPAKGGKESPKKPDEENLLFDQKNPRSFTASLKSIARNKMRSSE